MLDEKGTHEIEEQVQHEVEAAVAFAEESPYASVEEFMQHLEEYVYAPDEVEGKGEN
jgi:TPP-dependent pyruvate/acetoin dehydrogenase alpha subunit